METKFLSILVIFLLPQKHLTYGKGSQKCMLSQIHGLKALDCHDKLLNEFPKGLPSDVQVMDLSTNRIRKISKAEIEKYPYLTHLYLYDNFLQKLDSDTFDPLRNLQVLDLSINGLSAVPSGIFRLPSLKTLYLSKNMNVNIDESIRDVQTTSYSSLTKLDLSYISEEGAPIEFPNFAENSMVRMMISVLNITAFVAGNYINHMSTKHFAGLCNLQTLASSDVMVSNFIEACDCWNINKWLGERKVIFADFRCPIEERDCAHHFIPSEDISVYKKCQEQTQQIKNSTLLNKIGVWVGVALLIVAIVAAFLGYRCWLKRARRKKEQELKLMRNRIAQENEQARALLNEMHERSNLK